MLDIAFLEHVLVDLALAGRVENLFLDLGVDGELEADLLRQLLLAAVALRVFEFLEQLLDRAMILLEQRDRVLASWSRPCSSFLSDLRVIETNCVRLDVPARYAS